MAKKEQGNLGETVQVVRTCVTKHLQNQDFLLLYLSEWYSHKSTR